MSNSLTFITAVPRLIDLTLPSPALNLAADEALLDSAELSATPGILRFWESPVHFVVIGYSKRLDSEVDQTACAARHIPILRRCSGGGTVLQGPGCLNYSLILPIEPDGPLQSVTEANRWIMDRNARALSELLDRNVKVQGHTDLTLDGRKFSGNAQRRKRRCLLFHGTFLLHFNAQLMEAVLRPPPDQPAYRNRRSHADFLTALPVPASTASIRRALAEIWDATEPFEDWPEAEAERLAAEKYSTDAWNRRF